MCVFAAAVYVAVAWALPKAEWLPAQADMTMAFIAPQAENTALKQAWEEALKGSTQDLSWALVPLDLKAFEQKDPEVYAVLRELVGLSEDGKRLSLASVSMGMTVPKSIESDLGFKAVFIFENPALDAKAFDAAIRALVAKKAQEAGKDFSVVPMGEWMDFNIFTAEKERKRRFCYRPCAQGLKMVLAQDEAEAEAWLAGAKLAADAPVAAPFAAVKQPQDIAVALADLAGLLKRYKIDPKERKQLKLQMPWLFKTHRVMLAGTLEGATVVWTLSATTNSVQQTEQLKNFFEMYRFVIAQMLLPALLQKPDAVAIDWLRKQVSVKASGTEARLRMAFDPTTTAALVKEFEELEARREQEVEALRRKRLEREARESEGGEEMSAEEAKQILEGLEAK